MSTIRGNKKGIKDKALRELIDRYTSRMAAAAAQAGKEVLKELRESAVLKWYSSDDSFTGNAMNKATKYKSTILSSKGDEINILISSDIDFSKFDSVMSGSNKYHSIHEWRKRHEKDGWRYYGRGAKRKKIDMPLSVSEYIYNLPWEEGLTALPPHERKTGTGWKNPASEENIYNSLGNLEVYLKNKDGEIAKKWGKAVQKRFNEIMNK